jgi:hypothetical protein
MNKTRIYRWHMYNQEGRDMGVCELHAKNDGSAKRIRKNQAKAFGYKMGTIKSRAI